MSFICGRKVYLVQGKGKSQTVNICTTANKRGKYDLTIRLRPFHFITKEKLDELIRKSKSINELVTQLLDEYSGELERRPEDNSSPTPADSTPNSDDPSFPPPSSWEQNAKVATEQCIDQFVMEFIEFPYLHRREHSIHCELFKILSSRKIFACTHPMGRWTTQPIHKEWPEYLRRQKKGKRGEFDLCILAPERFLACSSNEFYNGRIRPSIVIEVGLNYSLRHLRADAAKLRNSGIENSFLVHLVREEDPGIADDFERVEQFLLECDMKAAYARLNSSRVFYKLVNDSAITSVALPLYAGC